MHIATVRFFTDTATLAIFDPGVLAHRVDDDADWWCGEFALLPEVQSGCVTIVALGSDGIYQVRVTDGELAQDERDYAVELVGRMGLEVRSGDVYIGPGECIPSDGHALDESDIERGCLMKLAVGSYLVDLYSISWFESPIWWRESGEAPPDAPVDIVVVLQSRAESYPGLQSAPRFTWSSREFLFPSGTRTLGPQPGMILKSKVRKNVDGRLSLADCGPGSFHVTLRDSSMLQWRREVRFRVATVDHHARSMCGEFVEFVD